MNDFLHIALSFPSVIFTVMLLVVVVYWLLVITGVFGLDLFDFDVDADLDVDVDIGALSAGADAGAEASLDVGAKILTSIFHALSVGQVPITISFSVFTLSSWVISCIGVHYTRLIFGEPGVFVGSGIFGLATIFSLVIAGVAVWPLRGLFETQTRRGQENLIGSICIVSTGKVDQQFGQATLEDGGAGLTLTVRSDTANNTLIRGSKALIVGYDEGTHTYLVEPYDTMLADAPIDEVIFDFDDATSLDAAVSTPSAQHQTKGDHV